MGNRTVFWLMLGLLLLATVAGVGYYAYGAGVSAADGLGSLEGVYLGIQGAGSDFAI